MSNWITRQLKETLTYWGNPVADGYGGFTFDDPITISGRWEDKSEIYLNNNAEEVRSVAVAFVDRDLDEGGYIIQGDYTDSIYDDPQDVSGARRIVRFSKTPTFDGKIYLRQVWL